MCMCVCIVYYADIVYVYIYMYMCRTIQTYVDTHASMPATAMYQYTARLYIYETRCEPMSL